MLAVSLRKVKCAQNVAAASMPICNTKYQYISEPLLTFSNHNKQCKHVHTWSQLAASFNKTKPWFGGSETWKELTTLKSGLFKYSELAEYTGMYILKEQMLDRSYTLIEEITTRSSERKMVELFDDLSDTICRVADLAEFLRHIHTDEEYADAAENVNAAATSLVEKLNTNPALYKALKKAVEEGDTVDTDDMDKFVAKLFLHDFEQSGVHLDRQKRERFVSVCEKLHTLGTSFLRGTQLPNAIPLSEVPEQLQHCFRVENNMAIVDHLYSAAPNEMLREAAYKIYLYPNKEQEETLDQLLSHRHELADLAGFESYAHRAAKGTMIESPDNIKLFLEELADELSDKAITDFDILSDVKSKDGGASSTALRPWDTQYYSNKVKQEMLELDVDAVKSYFSLGACMEGLNEIFTSLYGVSLHAEELLVNEGWYHDLHKLRVEDSDGTILGYIYCDFFERCVKPRQDSHFTIVGGKQLSDGTYQLPVVVICLNLAPVSSHLSPPCLLAPGQVENMFHEFGHAMHSMLARTRYQHVTGTRCSTDFAEVPSIIMEYFATDPRVVKRFARHYSTGQPIPDKLLDTLCNSRALFPASDMQFQVYYSMMDHLLHCPHPLPQSPSHLSAHIMDTYHHLGHVPNTSWYLRFGHLVGYGAKYYSYLLSKAVASRIWQEAFDRSPLDSTSGGRFREVLLSPGGSRPPMDLVEEFLGCPLSVSDLVKSLVDEVNVQQEKQKLVLSSLTSSS